MDKDVMAHVLYEIKEELNRRSLRAQDAEDTIRELEKRNVSMDTKIDGLEQGVSKLTDAINGQGESPGLKGTVGKLSDRMGMIYWALGVVFSASVAQVLISLFGGAG